MPSSSPSPIARSLATRAAGLLRVRWIVRAPITLYRAHLGFVLGNRMIMLEHTGRTTGARRYVVLEVVSHTRPGTYVVASGFGTRAQWFRNIRANPHVRVWRASHRPAPAIARLLDHEETASALAAYATRHPRAWATLKPVFEATLGARIDSQETSLPLIALDLDDAGRRAATDTPRP